MDQLPALTGIFFVLTTLLAVLLFHGAAQFSKSVLRALLIWLFFQAAVSLTGFYHTIDTLSAQFLLQLAPGFVVISFLFLTTKGKAFIDRLDLPTLTILHIIRIPVELVLFWLFFYQETSEIAIFQERNLDLLSGITAPVVMYFVFIKNTWGRNALLVWNLMSLGLLVNVVLWAILSAPLPFAYFVNQPNVAVLYFPFIWMSCCIIPLLVFSHLAAIRILLHTETAYPSLA